MGAMRKVKIVVDVLMTLLFFVVLGYHITEVFLHEVLGTALLVLVIAHNILNYKWFKVLFKGKYSLRRVLHTGINLMLLISMVCVMVSAIFLSRSVFAFLGLSGGTIGKIIHLSAGYWAFIMMGIHLGLHWSSFVNMAAKNRPLPKGLSIAVKVVALGIAGYGVYASFSRGLGTLLFSFSEFAFFDFSKPAFLFFIDYFAILGLYVFITHYAVKLLSLRKRTPVPAQNIKTD